MRKKRVLHCISHFSLGGAESVVRSIISSCADHIDFGVFSVRAFAKDNFGQLMFEEFRDLDIPVYWGSSHSNRSIQILWSILSLRRAVREFDPDIVHLHTELPEFVWSISDAIFFAKRGPKVMRTIHNSVLWPSWEFIGRISEQRLKNATVVAVSHGAKQGLQEFRKKVGVNPQKIDVKVIYNSIDFGAPRREIESKNYEKVVRIIYAGRLEYQKGADLIPDILTELERKNQNNISIDIFGSGGLLNDLRENVSSMNLSFPVNFFPPTSSLKDILFNYDLLIMPSRFEGFGIVAAEAAVAGVVPVASSCKGLVEVLKPSYPWLAEPGSAFEFAQVLIDVLNNRQRWSDVVAGLRQHCDENFNIERMSYVYLEQYGVPDESI